jgi:hypothetical protein
LGDSLNEPGLVKHFEAVSARKNQALYDAREHDSQMNPVLFEGLAELARRGYEWSGNKAISNVIKQRYAKIQAGNLHLLQTGETFKKLRGGGTGQSMTTINNTVGLELCMIASYRILTGRASSTFWDYFTNRVAGDNGMLGWNDPHFDIVAFQKVAKDNFGVDLAFDLVTKDIAMEFLSKQAAPGYQYKQEYEARNLPIPKTSVIHNPKMLALRRSGQVARLASAPLDNTFAED